jgi:predicted GIY-YIG superfamily endonuclease
MRRKKQYLVCNHIENLSRAVLEKYPKLADRLVRRRPGIYALYRGEDLYYLGLAENLHSRLKAHLKDRHKSSWDRFSVYLTIQDAHLRELEALTLRIMMPEGNKQKGKLKGSENLHNKLKGMLKDLQRDETTALLGLPVENEIDAETVSRRDEGREPVLAKYIDSSISIRGFHKGRKLLARVRKDGTIRSSGKVYTSLSLAAAAACGRPTCNGWTFWQYQRAKNDWVSINELRR